MRPGFLNRLPIHVQLMRHGSIVTAIILSVALAGCKTDELAENAHLAREAAQAVFNVVCQLPPDHVIRAQIRDAVGGATGLDTSRVCEQGLGSLLERRQAAFVEDPAFSN